MQSSQFYKKLWSIVIPVTLQGFIASAVNSADVFMLGYVGENALSGVSLANQIQFIAIGLFWGITSGTSLMTAQYWGKQDKDAIQIVMGIGLKISLLFTALLSAAALFSPEILMRLFTNDEKLIEVGVSYLRIISLSYLLESVSQVYECTLRSTDRAGASTAIGASALVGNVVLNACFIFGLFGFPRLGVVGVALATLISRLAETLLCLSHAAVTRYLPWRFHLLFGHHPLLVRDFIRYSVPALLNDFLWTLAFSTYSIILGHLGAAVVAASAVATTVRDLLTVLCMSIAQAAVAIIGAQIGAGKTEEARDSGGRFIRLSLIISAVTGVFILLLRPLVLRLFPLTAEAAELLDFMLIISSYYVIGQTINTTMIAGIFRAGGDTRFGMICDIVTMWVVAVPIGFATAFLFHAPIRVLYFILCLDEFYKIPVVMRHYYSYQWLHNVTRSLNSETEEAAL